MSPAAYREWRTEQGSLPPSRTAIEHFWPTFTVARAIALGDRDEVPPEAWET